jgi:diaminohydroxyphosphoribosylaminopyrimidine deaminase/5-amino-6-(5-phosphoribosylamino)uracil reductase
MEAKHIKYMERCNFLAKLGKGNVAPNPMVGSVVVHNDIIIGEGYHQKYGETHAEVNAINSVADKSLLKESTIYVNLEPCAHFGKTPPCANLIIDSKIPNVVIGCIDSYSEVAGKGVEKMKKAGINVTVGVLEKECLDINKRFFTFHNKQRPYIILKWAQSANGFIDIDRSKNEKGIFWITQPETKRLVHKWRTEESAILIGRKTLETDNPSLTAREYTGNNPTRIIIDKGLKTDYSKLNIFNDDVKTFIINNVINKTDKHLNFLKVDDFSLKQILRALYKSNLQSIIIEGGKHTLQQFINQNLWDEARILTGVNNIEQGIPSPTLNGNRIKSFNYGKDFVEVFESNF